jgi:trans-2,3-dihydro-3-hydroxyanthranilate isomerase
MPRFAYRIVNVFTRGAPLSGNPLCVFEDGRGLDDATLQALARQFNLSETTFILPSDKATARVRIFTPSYEMPFAGHPTLGTAHVVRAIARGGDKESRGGDAMALEMKAGVIPVNARGDRWTLQAVEPRSRAVELTRAELESILGLEPGDVAEWPLWVNAGKEQLLVPVTSAAAVHRARPRADAFSRLKSEDGQSMAYVFHDAGDAAGTVEARFFFPSGPAILEDPATGSACANLGGWFTVVRPRTDVRRAISQGEAVRRPSTLYLDVTHGAIHVGGDVIELGRGEVAL